MANQFKVVPITARTRQLATRSITELCIQLDTSLNCAMKVFTYAIVVVSHG